jgi:hypothetical protein
VAKPQRIYFCTEICQLASNDETFLSRVITGDLAPCDFFLSPKMKLKLKGRQFDTIVEIQAELQRVLDTLTEKDFRKRSKNAEGGTGVYMWEVVDRPYGVFYGFYSVSPEYFGYSSHFNAVNSKGMKMNVNGNELRPDYEVIRGVSKKFGEWYQKTKQKIQTN